MYISKILKKLFLRIQTILNNKAARLAFKSLLVVLFVAAILRHQGDLKSVVVNYEQLNLDQNWISWFFLLFAIVLMPINWILEGQKWRILMPDSHLNMREAVSVVLGGLSLGVVSPARVGEFVGRAFMTEEGDKWKSVFASLINSVAQNTTHLVFGLIGLLYMVRTYSLPIDGYWTVLVGLLILALLFCYFNAQSILRFVQRKVDWAFLQKVQPRDDINLGSLLFWTVTRYTVYTAQFVLLVYFFGSSEPVLPIVMAIFLIFLIQTGLPLPPFLSALARVEIAILILSYEVDNELLIVGSTLCLWMINVLGPSILGMTILLRRKATN